MCKFGLLQEEDKETLTIWVFGLIDGNESIPRDGATVRISPTEKEPWLHKQHEVAFYQYG